MYKKEALIASITGENHGYISSNGYFKREFRYLNGKITQRGGEI